MEETNQLVHSNKKVNKGCTNGDTVMGDQSRMEGVLSSDNTNQRRKVSYRETIMNKSIHAAAPPLLMKSWMSRMMTLKMVRWIIKDLE